MTVDQKLWLLPDCGGLIQTIAFCVPPACFDLGEEHNGFHPLVPIGNLLETLPHDVVALAFVDQATLALAEQWLLRLQIDCTIKLVPVQHEQGSVATLWIQDAIHVAGNVTDDDDFRTEILCDGQSVIGRAVARHLNIPTTFSHQLLPGGNQLVGDDFRLIGYASLDVRGSGGAGTIEAIARRRDVVQSLDERPIHVFGYCRQMDDGLAKPSSSDRLVQDPKLDNASQIPDRIARTSMHQCGFHVDQFVSLTGIAIDRRPLLLVADPVTLNGAENRMTSNLKTQLDASVVCLEKQGFHVLRNPVPLAITPDTGKRLPRLYNNILLENDIRTDRKKPLVWIPQFGDQEDLAEFDHQNIAIWAGLGFDPVAIHGWTNLASRNGAIRCATKVLRRCGSRR